MPTSFSSILPNREFAILKTRPNGLLPSDQAVTSWALKVGSLGNVRTQTLRAYRPNEIEKILANVS
jgi:hypothetical protein